MTGARQFKRSRLPVPNKLYGYEKEQNHSLEATLHSIVSHIDTGTKFDSEKCSALLDHLSLSEAEKWHVVAQTLYMNGARQGQISGKKIELAHQFALKALSLEQYNLLYWDTFFKVCRVIVAEWPDFQPPKAWSELLNFALKQNFLLASDKTWPIFQRVLENSKEFQSLVELVETHQENLDSLIETAGQNSLLLSFLRKAATNGVAMERLVTKLRKACCRAIASQKVDEDKAVNVASALALTCWWNGFLFSEDAEETEFVVKLEKELELTMSRKGPFPRHLISLVACYRPLSNYDWAKSLEFSSLKGSFGQLIINTVQYPSKEKDLKKDIETIGTISNTISVKVANQYEVSPYPCYNLHPRSVIQSDSLPNVLKRFHCTQGLESRKSLRKPKILIAGCGTGSHVIQTANRFKNDHIVAIDLSKSSLAYAKRKCGEAGLANITFYQADILNLESWQRRFDLIESVGVLHHTEDPIDSWKTLTDLLSSRGLMKIGLYSSRARALLPKFNRVDGVARDGFDASIIKKLRNDLIEEKFGSDKTYWSARERETTLEDFDPRQIGDFFKLASVRDLLFHEQEHRFNLIQISEILKKLGLRFLGMEVSMPILTAFSSEYGESGMNNLEKWHAFENRYPSAFTGMYQMWLQKLS